MNFHKADKRKICVFAGLILSFSVLISGCANTSDSTTYAHKKIHIASITLKSLQGKYVAKGCSLQLKATVNPSSAIDKRVEWISSDETIATVDSDGLVTGVNVSNEPVRITVKSLDKPDIKQSIEIFVVQTVVRSTGLSLTSVGDAVTGKSISLTPVFEPSDVTDKSVIYESSDETTAKVLSDGTVQFFKNTTQAPVVITAKAGDGGSTSQISFNVSKLTYEENFTFSEVEASKTEGFTSKRGVGFNTLTQNQVQFLANGNVEWAYNWGKTPGDGHKNYIGPGKILNYAPMLWGNPSDEDITALRTYLSENSGVKYLLGINEPNMGYGQGGCYTTPEAAAEKWPLLEELAEEFNLKLASPAMTYSGEQLSDGKIYSTPESWLDAFINAYKVKWGSFPKMDVLALHCYMAWPGSVVGFCDKYADYYNSSKYSGTYRNIKVILTEFCAWNDEGVSITESWQCEKMAQKIEALDQDDNVEGYAWFMADGSITERPWNSLFMGTRNQENTGWNYENELSRAGLIYTYLSNHNENKYFGTGKAISVVDYITSSNYQKQMPDPYRTISISYDKNDDSQSVQNIPLIFSNFGLDAFANYQITVADEGLYSLYVRYFSNEDKLVGINGSEYLLPSTNNQWKTYRINVYLKSGNQNLNIFSNNSIPCKMALMELLKE